MNVGVGVLGTVVGGGVDVEVDVFIGVGVIVGLGVVVGVGVSVGVSVGVGVGNCMFNEINFSAKVSFVL